MRAGYFMRPTPVCALFLFALAIMACPTLGVAGAGQLHGGPALGGSVSTGSSIPPSQAGYSGLVAVSGAYGLNDTFRVYGHVHYALGVGKDALNTPRHEASLSAGLA